VPIKVFVTGLLMLAATNAHHLGTLVARFAGCGVWWRLDGVLALSPSSISPSIEQLRHIGLGGELLLVFSALLVTGALVSNVARRWLRQWGDSLLRYRSSRPFTTR
jgi:hypothetical protein